MSFSALILIIFFVFLILKTYKSIASVLLGIFILFGGISLILLYGYNIYTANPEAMLLERIPARGFYHIITGLYVFCTFASVKIIRNYLKYKEVNR